VLYSHLPPLQQDLRLQECVVDLPVDLRPYACAASLSTGRFGTAPPIAASCDLTAGWPPGRSDPRIRVACLGKWS